MCVCKSVLARHPVGCLAGGVGDGGESGGRRAKNNPKQRVGKVCADEVQAQTRAERGKGPEEKRPAHVRIPVGRAACKEC